MDSKLQQEKEQYARHVALFLAESLRTRKISLHHAAEIAQKFVDNANLIDNEEQFLRFIKILSADFEPLFHLRDRISFDAEVNKRKELEDKVRFYVIKTISQDAKIASDILREAAAPNANLAGLTQKFPGFKEFIEEQSHEQS